MIHKLFLVIAMHCQGSSRENLPRYYIAGYETIMLIQKYFFSIVLADTPLFRNGSRYIGDETNFFFLILASYNSVSTDLS